MARALFAVTLALTGYALANWLSFVAKIDTFPDQAVAIRSAALRGVLVLGLAAIPVFAYRSDRAWDARRSLSLLGGWLCLAASCGVLLYVVDPLAGTRVVQAPAVYAAIALLVAVPLLRVALRRPSPDLDSPDRDSPDRDSPDRDSPGAQASTSCFRPRRGQVLLALALGALLALLHMALRS